MIEQKPSQKIQKRQPGASKHDLNSFRDIAINLEETAPFEAYALYRFVLKHRPRSAFLRNKVEKLEGRTKKDCVVAWRNDGLCERINAILIGYFTAKHLGLDFRFLWPDLSFLREKYQIQFDQGHTVPEDASCLLSGSFISDFQIQESDLLVPKGGFIDPNLALKPFVLDDFDKFKDEEEIVRPCWLAGWRSFPEFEDAFETEEFRAFFRDTLFNDTITSLFRAIDSCGLPEKRVGIHLRGGDVVYNDARHTHTYARIKTYSMAVAEALCADFTTQGYTVVLFGANPKDLEFLARDRADVLTAADLELGDVDLSAEVIRDVWLMSGCEQIISAEDTGVSKLAALLGHVRLAPFSEIVTPAQEYRLSLECVETGRIAEFPFLQQAFIHYSLFMTAPEEVTVASLHQHATDALRCDPGNVQYMLLCLLSAYALEDREKVETFNRKLADTLSGPVSTCFTDPKLRGRYIRLKEPSVQRVLSTLIQQEQVPTYIKDMV